MENELAYKMHLDVSSESDDDQKDNLDDEYEAMKPPVRTFDSSKIFKVQPPSPKNVWAKQQLEQGTSSSATHQSTAVELELFSSPNFPQNVNKAPSSTTQNKRKKKKKKNNSNGADSVALASVINETKCDNYVTSISPSVNTDTVTASSPKLSALNVENTDLAPNPRNTASTSKKNNVPTVGNQYVPCDVQQTSSVPKKKGVRTRKGKNNCINNHLYVGPSSIALKQLSLFMLEKSIAVARSFIHLSRNEFCQLIRNSIPAVTKIVATELSIHHPTNEALCAAIIENILARGLIYRGCPLPIDMGKVVDKLNLIIPQIAPLFSDNHDHESQRSSTTRATPNKPIELSKHMDKVAKTVANHRKKYVPASKSNAVKHVNKSAKLQATVQTLKDEKDKPIQLVQPLRRAVKSKEIKLTQQMHLKSKNSTKSSEPSVSAMKQNGNSAQKKTKKDAQKKKNKDLSAHQKHVQEQFTTGNLNHPNQSRGEVNDVIIINGSGYSEIGNLNIKHDSSVEQQKIHTSESNKVDVISNLEVSIPEDDTKVGIKVENSNVKKSDRVKTQKNTTADLSYEMVPLLEVHNVADEEIVTSPIIHADVTESDELMKSLEMSVKEENVLMKEVRRYSKSELLEINDLQKCKGYILDNNIKIPEKILVSATRCKTPKLTKSPSTSKKLVQTDIVISPTEEFFFSCQRTGGNLICDRPIISISSETLDLSRKKNDAVDNDNETLFDKIINLVLIFTCIELVKIFLNNGLWLILVFLFKFSMILLALLGFYKCLN